MNLAQRIREARKAAKLSLDEAAAAAGISKTYLWELEKDADGLKRPSADILLSIACALKVDLHDLLEDQIALKTGLTTDAQLIRLLQEQIAELGSLRAWAKAHDFAPSFISDALSGRRNVTERLALALGYKRAAYWEKSP
jgi:transcriptional regulator with XRE-family HTH domain